MKIIFTVLFICSVAVAGNIKSETVYPGFRKIGSFDGAYADGNTYGKIYWVSTHFKVQWHAAKSLCHSYGMELVSFETAQEENQVLSLCNQNRNLFDQYTHIGGISTVARSKFDWFWANSGNKVNFGLNFLAGQPNNLGNNQMCLALDKQPSQFMYNDINCSGNHDEKFICQSRT